MPVDSEIKRILDDYKNFDVLNISVNRRNNNPSLRQKILTDIYKPKKLTPDLESTGNQNINDLLKSNELSNEQKRPLLICEIDYLIHREGNDKNKLIDTLTKNKNLLTPIDKFELLQKYCHRSDSKFTTFLNNLDLKPEELKARNHEGKNIEDIIKEKIKEAKGKDKPDLSELNDLEKNLLHVQNKIKELDQKQKEARAEFKNLFSFDSLNRLITDGIKNVNNIFYNVNQNLNIFGSKAIDRVLEVNELDQHKDKVVKLLKKGAKLPPEQVVNGVDTKEFVDNVKKTNAQLKPALENLKKIQDPHRKKTRNEIASAIKEKLNIDESHEHHDKISKKIHKEIDKIVMMQAKYAARSIIGKMIYRGEVEKQINASCTSIAAKFHDANNSRSR